MAKGSKKDKATGSAPVPRSVLSAAWERFELGDVVEARRLAQAVLDGQVGPDDPRAAKSLAKELSTPTAVVGEAVPEVATAMLVRIRPVAAAYWFAVLALSILTGLVLLATVRYSH
jgi:hypothetical protein